MTQYSILKSVRIGAPSKGDLYGKIYTVGDVVDVEEALVEGLTAEGYIEPVDASADEPAAPTPRKRGRPPGSGKTAAPPPPEEAITQPSVEVEQQ